VWSVGAAQEKFMNATTLGLAFGIALGLAAAFGGFGAFLTVLVIGALGLLAGRMAEGKLDLSQLTNGTRAEEHQPHHPGAPDPSVTSERVHGRRA
jgi:hypothetical protein